MGCVITTSAHNQLTVRPIHHKYCRNGTRVHHRAQSPTFHRQPDLFLQPEQALMRAFNGVQGLLEYNLLERMRQGNAGEPGEMLLVPVLSSRIAVANQMIFEY